MSSVRGKGPVVKRWQDKRGLVHILDEGARALVTLCWVSASPHAQPIPRDRAPNCIECVSYYDEHRRYRNGFR